MNYKKITKSERIELENRHFNGYQFQRKRSAYESRAQFYSNLNKCEWNEMIDFFNHVCCNCESDVLGGNPTKDHIIPITLGGTNHISNLQPLCRECNSGNIDMVDFRLIYCKRNGLILPNKWKKNGNK